MLKRLSKKTSFILIGIVVGLFIGVSIKQAFGGTDTSTVDQRNGNLAVNIANVYQNGLLVPYGNVGIGVVNPTVKLDVVGDIKTTGSIKSNNLCIGATCINENQLKALLAVGGTGTETGTPTVNPPVVDLTGTPVLAPLEPTAVTRTNSGVNSVVVSPDVVTQPTGGILTSIMNGVAAVGCFFTGCTTPSAPVIDLHTSVEGGWNFAGGSIQAVAGTPFTLYWSQVSGDATSCTGDGSQDITAGWVGDKPISGSFVASITHSTLPYYSGRATYYLTCTGVGGTTGVRIDIFEKPVCSAGTELIYGDFPTSCTSCSEVFPYNTKVWDGTACAKPVTCTTPLSWDSTSKSCVEPRFNYSVQPASTQGCTIPLGGSSCSVKYSWNHPIGFVAYTVTYQKTGTSGDATIVTVPGSYTFIINPDTPYNQRQIVLEGSYHQRSDGTDSPGWMRSSNAFSAVCASGKWNGSSCSE